MNEFEIIQEWERIKSYLEAKGARVYLGYRPNCFSVSFNVSFNGPAPSFDSLGELVEFNRSMEKAMIAVLAAPGDVK